MPLTGETGHGTLRRMSDRPSNVTPFPGVRPPTATQDVPAPEEAEETPYSLDGMLACLDGYAERFRLALPLASRVPFDVAVAQVRAQAEGLDDVRLRLMGTR